MTFLEETTMYCTICGGPIFEPGLNCPSEWLGQAVLLHADDHQAQESPILEILAVNTRGPYFTTEETHSQVSACHVATHSLFGAPKPLLYIPCHTRCLSIAKRVISSSPSAETKADSLHHIWNVLKARCVEGSKNSRGPLHKVFDPNGYHGVWKMQGMEWEPGDDPSLNYEAQHFEADPTEIPNLTNSLLSNLYYLRAETLPTTDLKNSISQLPPEIINNIIQHLNPFSDPPVTCTYLSPPLYIPPTYWRRVLQDGVLLHWLPPLNATDITSKETSLTEGKQWDWELLVRQLAQQDLHHPGEVLGNLPLGLRNRRRIWRLVEDILSTPIMASET